MLCWRAVKFLRASPGAASPLSFIVLSMLVWELSLKGFPGQDSAAVDDLGDPSGAFEDLGGSLQHSKQDKFETLGI